MNDPARTSGRRPTSKREGSLANSTDRTFAEFHEGYLRHYVALADTKAGLLFGLVSSLIAYLFSQPAYHQLAFAPRWYWLSLLAIAGAALLGAGALGAVLVIVPRLRHTGEGLVFFGAVAKFETSQAYAEAVQREDDRGLTTARLRHCYDVSHACARKYRALRNAIWLSFAGIVVSLPILAMI